MGFHGFDISEYQGMIDWSKIPVKFSFAIIRAGFGVTSQQVDKCFHQNMLGAISDDFRVGCYWFLYALNVEDSIRNAEAFLEVIKPYEGNIDYPLVLDVEGDTIRYMKSMGVEPSKYLISEMVKAFCDRIEKAGYYVMVYSDNNFINTYFTKEVLERYDLWFAYWTTIFEPSYCIRDCGIWQHTNNGKVEGIEGRVDLDYAERDYARIIADAGLNHLFGELPVSETKKTFVSGSVTETDTQVIIVLEKKV